MTSDLSFLFLELKVSVLVSFVHEIVKVLTELAYPLVSVTKDDGRDHMLDGEVGLPKVGLVVPMLSRQKVTNHDVHKPYARSSDDITFDISFFCVVF